jgi:hypothetical protein
MTARDHAEELLVHYMRTAWQAAGLRWDDDNEVRSIVDALHGMVVAEIQKHAEDAPHMYPDGSRA